MYYVRTADRLQRTAAWVEDHEGGLDAIRAVILEDSLGIAADLDAAMARHVGDYEDEWRAVLEDPEKLRRFGSFVNAPAEPDPDLAYVTERGQIRPATADERAALEEARAAGLATVPAGPVVIAGTTLEVRR